jgi:TatD DNase family protein
MKYIDIHSHLNFPEYDADREAVLARMAETETGTIVVGTDFESSRRAVVLAEQHDNIWACIGVHPVDDPKITFEREKFRELIVSPKVVAIGECGLDFFHADKSDEKEIERQKQLFLEQVDFAIAHKKPLMIHSRAAYEELLGILEPLKKEHGGALRGDVHFFAGELKTAKRFWDIGFTTSFTGVITFARNYDEVIKDAPFEMLMSETDAPFVTPAPYRGKKNEPSYVSEVVKKIAEIRGEEEEIVRKTLLENACRVFNIVIM